MNNPMLMLLIVIMTISLSGCSLSSDNQQECRSYAASYQVTCPFCRIVAKQDPATVIYEDDLVLAFEKKPPRKPVSCLIIPKKHFESLKSFDAASACDAAIIIRMMSIAQILSKKLTNMGDFRITINNGKEAGQTVFHVHMHFESPENWR